MMNLPAPLLLLLGLWMARAGEIRTWTFAESGKAMEAEVAGFTDTGVTLREASGKTFSVPINYLSKSDRAYLAAEQARQWREVEVVKLDAATVIGQYRKCTVRGSDIGGELYIERLPASVVTILQDRNRQAAPIAALSRHIEGRKGEVQEAKADLPAKGAKSRASRQAVRAQRSQLNVETSGINAMEIDLAKLQKAYDDSVQKTKSQTVVRMRNTGVLHKGLPLWQCFESRRPQ